MDDFFSPTVTIHFQQGYISCKYCPLLETYSRNKCRMTAEYIVDDRVIGRWCPFRDAAEDYQLRQETKQ